MLVPCLVLLLQLPGPRPAPAPLWIEGATVWTDPGAEPLRDARVRLENGRVSAVGPREPRELPEGARVLDARGYFLVAGFQNSHVHFTEPERWKDAERQEGAELERHLAELFLSHGFTTVVDTGSLPANTLALHARIERGELRGPRILTAGVPLYPRDGVPYYVRPSLAPEQLAELQGLDTAAEAEARVEAQLAGGCTLVKLFTSSWVERGRALPMQEEVARAAVARAHAHGALVVSHASDVAGLELALEAGVDLLAHVLDDTRGLEPFHLESLRTANVALIPTLQLLGGAPEAVGQVRDFARLGGTLLFGTDVGFLADPDPSAEFAHLAAAGLDGRAILAMLTTAPAARFGEGEQRGRIAAGHAADLVLLGSDPLGSAQAFTDVRRVWRAGVEVWTRP